MNPIILIVGLLLGMAVTVVPMYYIDNKYSHRTLLPLHITATAMALLITIIASLIQHDFVWTMALGSIIVCAGYFIIIGILAWGVKHDTE